MMKNIFSKNPSEKLSHRYAVQFMWAFESTYGCEAAI